MQKDNWKIQLFRYLKNYDVRFKWLVFNEIDYQYGPSQGADVNMKNGKYLPAFTPKFWGNLWGLI